MNRDFRVAMDYIHVVPLLEGICDRSVRLSVGMAKIGHRFARENDAPTERIVRAIPFEDIDLMSGVSLLHQNRRVQTSGPTADNGYLHVNELRMSWTSNALFGISLIDVP